MTVSVQDMYSLRECLKIVLPEVVEGNISKLRRTAMVFKSPYRPVKHGNKYRSNDNWREKFLIECVRTVKEREDPEYSDVFSIFNKIAKSSCEKLSNDIIQLIHKRDETFRLRVSTLMFDKAITNHMFASVMADCALHLSKVFPDIIEDLHTQNTMFDTLYNMNDTITCSDTSIIEWTKQKEKRRGYAKFVTELNNRGLLTDESVQKGLDYIVTELVTLLQQVKSPQTDENIHQCAVFLYETLKTIHVKNTSSRKMLKIAITNILVSKPPTLSMKTRFKLEDALKMTG